MRTSDPHTLASSSYEGGSAVAERGVSCGLRILLYGTAFALAACAALAPHAHAAPVLIESSSATALQGASTISYGQVPAVTGSFNQVQVKVDADFYANIVSGRLNYLTGNIFQAFPDATYITESYHFYPPSYDRTAYWSYNSTTQILTFCMMDDVGGSANAIAISASGSEYWKTSYSHYDDGSMYTSGHPHIYGTGNPSDWTDPSNSPYLAFGYNASCGSPEPSTPSDPIGTTGVIRVNSPSFTSTTTSPVAVSFDYTLATSSDSSTNNLLYKYYRLVFTNSDTGAIYTRYGLLDNDTYGSFAQSTTTPLTGNGTWRLVVNLAVNNQDGLGYFQGSRAAQTFFGLSYLTDTSVYQDYVPRAQTEFASSSCQISFAGTFDLPQCLGYLVVPSTGSSSPVGQLKDLTLAHSFPFAYAYQLGDLYAVLFGGTATSTATTSIAVTVGTSTSAWHITFLSEDMLANEGISPFVKTVLTWLLYFLLAEFVYHRIIRVHDVNTPK